eukprot:TRINITY_DN7703_c0_g1_i1.p1 TRINITY_DN7703_c0_g1~~TRINITY_DN7703_c0_g1_i1.p1  ORF type:complete len:406 (-),score=68.64 TRINITY_DN7703_c0_g1_i1:45-1262(-)
MGMDAYRFSVSWSRILPKGTVNGGINRAGLDYYNKLINELLRNGIKPFITLFHWDLPQALEDAYGGFLSRRVVKDFAEFARICFKEFGDRVKHWITLNEPWTFASISYDYGTMAPGRCSKFVGNCSEGDSAREPYTVAHNLLLAHAAAASLYSSQFQATQKGYIGISLSMHWMVPYSKGDLDQRAAQRAVDFMYGWFMDPITRGDYPASMKTMLGSRLPAFTKEESKSLKGSFHFLGLNYYTSRYVLHEKSPPSLEWTSYSQDSHTRQTAEKNGIPIGKRGASEWLYIYPKGLRDLLVYTKTHYNNPPIFITENGIDDFNNESVPLKEALNDRLRIEYFRGHLEAVKEAIAEGVDVRGYFAWSLLDNFEWHMGYTLRFGLHFVDYSDGLKRYPKASSLWFAHFLH